MAVLGKAAEKDQDADECRRRMLGVWQKKERKHCQEVDGKKSRCPKVILMLLLEIPV